MISHKLAAIIQVLLKYASGNEITLLSFCTKYLGKKNIYYLEKHLRQNTLHTL